MFGDVRTKREIFAALGQGATLRDGVLTFTPNKWFQPIMENYAELEAEYHNVRTKNYGSTKEQTAAFATVSSHWGRIVDDIRTIFKNLEPKIYVYAPALRPEA